MHMLSLLGDWLRFKHAVTECAQWAKKQPFEATS
jgi:hypothetical protein